MRPKTDEATRAPVASGFASPATEYSAAPLDLGPLLVPRPTATFYFRFRGQDGAALGVADGDLLVVDRSLEAVPGRLWLLERDGQWCLVRGGRQAPDGRRTVCWGTVTWIIRRA